MTVPAELQVEEVDGHTLVRFPLPEDHASTEESIDEAVGYAMRFIGLSLLVCAGAAVTLWSTGGAIGSVLVILLVPLPWVMIAVIARQVLRGRLRGRPWMEIGPKQIGWGWDALNGDRLEFDALRTANVELELVESDDLTTVEIRDREVPDHGLHLDLPADQAAYVAGLVQSAG